MYILGKFTDKFLIFLETDRLLTSYIDRRHLSLVVKL